MKTKYIQSFIVFMVFSICTAFTGKDVKSFEIKLEKFQNQVSIEWEAEDSVDRLDVSHFQVRKALADLEYKTIGIVPANNPQSSYKFLDANCNRAGKVAYLVEKVYKTGNKSKSVPAWTEIIRQISFNIHNNNLRSSIEIEFDNKLDQPVDVKILDLRGEILREYSLSNGAESVNSEVLNLSIADIPKGLHFIQVDCNGEIKPKKIIRI